MLVEAFRYHKWANLHLLDVCAKLSDRQLQWTAPGTYGTIAATFQHLVGAERRYLWRLGGSQGRFAVRHKFPGVAALREQAATNGDQLIEIAGQINSVDITTTKFRRETVKIHLWVILVQALHHGNDHRTHICTILGRHDMRYGDMDVWAYGDAMGA